MARSRNIKPSFFTNDKLAECDPLARLLFAGLWTIADRAGRLEDRPKKIKAEVLPYDNCDADKLINQLCKYGFLIRYSVDKTQYIQIINFEKHQNPHMKESASTIPAPDLHQTCTIPAQPLTDSLNPLTDSPIPHTETPSIGEFDFFWKAYPHKVGKGDAAKAFKTAIKKTTLDEIIKAIHRYVQTKPPDRPYCNPSTWLNQERWNDEPARNLTPLQAKPTEQRSGAITL